MKIIYFFILIFSLSGCQNDNSSSKVTYNETQAKELYKKCQRCHGKKAELHALRRSDIIAYYKKEDIVKALKAYKKGKRDRHRYGYLMKGIVSDLSEYDINILAEYISKFKKSNK